MPKGLQGFQKGHKVNIGNKHSLGITPSDISRNKMIESHTGKKKSEDTKKKMSNSKLGKNNPNFGKVAWNKCKSPSQASKDKMSESHKKFTGDKSNFWKGGKMKDYIETEQIRKSLEYKLWRKAVFERDDFTCQKTGVSGCKLNAHHINNFADFTELRVAIDNGVTLSEVAHKKFHKIYGKNNNTREQLEEFIRS